MAGRWQEPRVSVGCVSGFQEVPCGGRVGTVQPHMETEEAPGTFPCNPRIRTSQPPCPHLTDEGNRVLEKHHSKLVAELSH